MRGDAELGFTDVQTVSYVCSCDCGVDWGTDGAELVQRPPSDQKLGRVVHKHADDGPVFDSEPFKCFSEPADFFAQLTIGPGAVLEKECLLVGMVVLSVCGVENMVE